MCTLYDRAPMKMYSLTLEGRTRLSSSWWTSSSSSSSSRLKEVRRPARASCELQRPFLTQSSHCLTFANVSKTLKGTYERLSCMLSPSFKKRQQYYVRVYSWFRCPMHITVVPGSSLIAQCTRLVLLKLSCKKLEQIV